MTTTNDNLSDPATHQGRHLCMEHFSNDGATVEHCLLETNHQGDHNVSTNDSGESMGDTERDDLTGEAI